MRQIVSPEASSFEMQDSVKSFGCIAFRTCDAEDAALSQHAPDRMGSGASGPCKACQKSSTEVVINFKMGY